MKRAAIGILALAAAGAAVFAVSRMGNNGPEFRTERPQRGDIASSVSATGTVNPVNTVLVGTQVSGTVKKLFADFNSTVKAGQMIALIDPAAFEAQLEQAMANLTMAKAEVERSGAAVLEAERAHGRARDLVSRSFAARAELDTAETNLVMARANLNVSKARVVQAKASADLAETNLRYTRIKSPVDGVVISRNVSEGQTVAASFQTPTLFSIAVDLTEMQIDSNIAEADIGRIREGMQVEFRVDAHPDRAFKGVVHQVRNAAITVQNVVTYDVVVKVDNKELLLKPGMTANVSVILERKAGVLKVPNAALRFSPPNAEKSREPSVWILEDGRLERVPVKKGLGDGTFTEVESPRLSADIPVITEQSGRQQKQKMMPPPPGMPFR
jgi:HlyD family secretion protein